MRSCVPFVGRKVQSEVGKLFCNSMASGGLLLSRVNTKSLPVVYWITHGESTSLSLTTRLTTISKEGVERCREPEAGEDPREAVSSEYDRVGALRSSGYLELPAQGLDKATPLNIQAWSIRGSWEEPVFFKDMAPKVNHALLDGPTSWHAWVIQIRFAGLLKVLGGTKLE